MKKIIVISLSLFFILIGCSKNSTITNPPANTTGGLTFKFDPKSVPAGVNIITATLTRTNFTTITKNLNLLSDTSADVTIPALQIGTWHLKVDAKDNNATILYTGETDVVVQENIVVQLNLTLNPVSSGTGTIYIFVTWGSGNSAGQWTDYKGNPVLTRYNNPSSPAGVSMGTVIYDNGIYKMWYEAFYYGGLANIWYAESPDGVAWNTIGSGPVLTKGVSGSWDDNGVAPSLVMKVNNQYRLYYLGWHDTYGKLSVGIAFSTDGITWEKNNAPVMSEYFSTGLTDIVKKDSLYMAYFHYNSVRSGINDKIGMATSYDGINWTMYGGNPILTPTLSWEGSGVYFATVVFENNTYKMVYSNAVEQNAFGMATSSDGFHFTKQSAPFFKNTSTLNNYVQTCYPYFKKLNNEYRIYYTGVNNANQLSINFIWTANN